MITETQEIDAILIIDLKSGTPLFSKIESPKIDDALVSGFISAINGFSKEIALGSLSSLITDEKIIYTVSREHILVALITSKEQEFEKIYSLGMEIANKFEEKFSEISPLDVEKYITFENDVQEILKKIQTPFIIKVANFIKKEYGGEISINPVLKTKSGKKVIINIISDRGRKKTEDLRDKLITKLFKGFSENVVFVKAIDGVAGKGEVQEFIELMRDFGITKEEKTDSEFFPYFPAYCVIVAKEFSPTVMEYINTLDKEKGKPFISGISLHKIASMKMSPSSYKCFIELWKWKEPYPEKIV